MKNLFFKIKKFVVTNLLTVGIVIGSSSFTSQASTMYTTANLNVRIAPTSQSDIYDTLKRGSEVSCTENNINGWQEIQIDNLTYYVFDDYLTENKVDSEAAIYSPSYFKTAGVIYWGDYRWTYYSARVLPGSALNIPGRHSDENGYICDENEYICIASGAISKGTIIQTPFGKCGKIYDYCPTAGVMDTYVSW